MTDERGDLRPRLAALEERVRRLERQHTGMDAASAEPGHPRHLAPGPGAEQFWALEMLRQRAGAPFDDGAVAGSLLFAGTASTPGVGSVICQEEHPLPAMLAEGWADAAGALSALGHPVRLELVRRLLAGAHTTHELAEIPDLGTSGQLYHHLRELQAAGLVVQRRRNDYTVRADRVILCLVLVAAAKSCAHAGSVEEAAS
ncbi:MAG: winged helix-turn-helix transcriptional regulator [Streptosporangiaceae bacterium]|nr:winged helix-turn-helix transcriptional regulator [Streptosporangiaceae bacterium]MBV9853991.1 winged helix-turn-helix transcriptional regulator [Streptosporangiaceae bacterium]